MNRITLPRHIQTLLFLCLLYAVLYYGKSFLIPVAFGGLLSMLLLPISSALERKGWKRPWAVLVSELVLLLFFAGIFALLAWQVSDMTKDAAKIEQGVTQKINMLRDYATNALGIPPQKQQQIIQKQQSSSSGKMAQMLSGAVGSIGSIITDALLVLIYIFLFSYYRSHLKKFVLQLVPSEKREETVEVMSTARKVAQKYMGGLAMMIVFLWIMYGIGFSIAGVKNALFFAVLCGLLEIIPFVGNLTGTGLTLFMSIAQGGSSAVLIGILVTYALVQFIQSYLIEPLVVGREVNLNPLFTIVGIVAGEFVWGIAGMVLAIPVMGILKIICDHVPQMKPYGFLLGEEKKEEGGGFAKKIKEWFRKRRGNDE